MNKFSVAMVFGAALAAVGLSAQGAVTNYWAQSTGGSWNTGTWTAKNADGSETAVVHNADRVYDFSELASGETVTCDVDKVQPIGFVFSKKAEGDNWTLVSATGKNLTLRDKKPVVVVPEGTTLNFQMLTANAYGGSIEMTFTGGGTVNFNSAAWKPYCMRVILDGTKLVLQKDTEPMAFRLIGDDANLTFAAAATVMGFESTGTGTPMVDTGSFNVFTKGGFSGYSPCSYGGYMKGSAVLTITGGVTQRFTLPDAFKDFTGEVKCENGDLYMSEGALMNDNRTLNLSLYGRFCSSNDQTVAAIKGEGVSGGVDIPAGRTFTAGKAGVTASTTMAGRIVGDGSFVKDGSAYALTLTGPSTYKGTTEVKAGTLALESAMTTASDESSGEVVRLSFEDAATIGWNSVAGGPMFAVSAGTVLTNGVVGKAVFLVDGKNMTATSDLFPKAAEDHTVSVWLKADPRNSTQQWPQVFLQGKWNAPVSLRWLAYNYDNRLFSRYMVHQQSTEPKGYDGTYDFPIGSATKWSDKGWQHVAVTVEGRSRKLYLNGELVSTSTLPAETATNLTQSVTLGGQFYGAMDEFVYAKGAWSADRVKAEYMRIKTAFAAAHDPAEDLPAPVAHYAFDDASNPGKDSSGNGYDLVNPGSVYIPELKLNMGDAKTYTTKAPTIVTDVPESIGGCAYFQDAQKTVLVYPWTNAFPAKIPTGNRAFSISVRYQMSRQMGPTLVGWGDEAQSDKHIRVMNGSSPAYNSICDVADGASHGSPEANLSAVLPGAQLKNRITWTHVVWTWNPETKKFAGYFDGILKADVGKNKGDKTALDLQPTNLVVGLSTQARTWGSTGEKFFTGYVDDVRIYDCVLSAAQVKALTQSLATGTVGPTLPVGTDVTVDSGATLKVSGAGHVFGDLSGAGTVELAGGVVTVTNGSAFAGSLTGSGTLRTDGASLALTGADAGFCGDFEVRNGTLALTGAYPGAVVRLGAGGQVTGCSLAAGVQLADEIVTDSAGTGLPVGSTGGNLWIPDAGTVRVTDLDNLEARWIVLAEGGTIRAPEDFSGWKLEGVPNDRITGAVFDVKDGQFRLRVKYAGTTILIR